MSIAARLALLPVAYVFIHNPRLPGLPVTAVKIVLLLAVFYLFIDRRLMRVVRVFRRDAAWTVGIAAYVLVIATVGAGSGGVLSYQLLIWFMEGFFIAAFLFYLGERKLGLPAERLAIQVGVLGAVISIFLVLNPALNDVARSFFQEATASVGPTAIVTHRGYAISESALGSFGSVQGLMAVLVIMYSRSRVTFTVALPLILVSIAFNQRLGLVLFAVGVVVLMVADRKKGSVLYTVGLVAALALMLGGWLRENHELTYYYLASMMNQLLSRETDSPYVFINTVDYLLRHEVHFPRSLGGLVFGEGAYISADAFRGSDVGYINYIYIGGITVLVLMAGFLARIVHRLANASGEWTLALVIAAVLLVAHIKGLYLFWPGGLSRLVVLLYVAAVLRHHHEVRRRAARDVPGSAGSVTPVSEPAYP
jgi:hypothetical protein